MFIVRLVSKTINVRRIHRKALHNILIIREGFAEIPRLHFVYGKTTNFHGAFLELLVDRLAMANVRLSQLLADRNISIF